MYSELMEIVERYTIANRWIQWGYPLGFALGLVCGLLACWVAGGARIEIHWHAQGLTNRYELVLPSTQPKPDHAQTGQR